MYKKTLALYGNCIRLQPYCSVKLALFGKILYFLKFLKSIPIETKQENCFD